MGAVKRRALARKTAAVPAKQTRLRAELGTLQRRLSALNVEGDDSARRLLGDAARFLGAALARLQEVDETLSRAAALAPLPSPQNEAPAIGESPLELFENAFRHAMIGMAIVDLAGRPVKVNDAFCRLLGQSEEELRRDTVFALTHPDDIEASLALIERLLSGEVPSARIEKRYVRKDGSILWGLLSLSLVRTADEKPLYLIAQVEDIGERRATLAALYESEQRFQSAFDDAPVGMVLARPDGQPLRVNRALCQMVGYTAAELLAMRPNQISHPEDVALARQRHESALAGPATAGTVDLRYLHQNGDVVWGRVASSLVRDASGQPSHIIVQIENITARKESEERFALAVAGASDGIWDWNSDTGVIYVSPRLAAILGFASGEIGTTPHALFAGVHPDDQARVETDVRAHIEGRTPQYVSEYRVQHRDGSYRWVLSRGVAVRGPDGLARRMAGSLTDITQRKEAEQALRESEGQFRTLAETVAAACFIFQGETLRYVNSSAERITGFTRQELLGMTFWDVIHPDFRGLVRDRGMARQRGDALPSQYEVKLRTKDGTERWVQFSAGMISFDGQVAVLGTAFDITDRKRSEEALRASEVQNRAILNASPDTFIRIRRDGTILDVKGDSSSWRTPPEDTVGRNLSDVMPPEMAAPAIATIGRAVTSGQQTYEFETPTVHGVLCLEARIVAYGEDEALCSIRDITARRRAEQESRQRLNELAHVSRVSNMGEMAAALAHELNQPLMAIVGYASGCALRVEAGTIETSELQAALRQVSTQAVRAGEILRGLRDFVRKGRPQRRPVNVNDLAREVTDLADVEARTHGVTLRMELDATIPAVLGDPIQIEQVMLNLIRNGIEAMSETVAPRILTLQTSCLSDRIVAVTVIDRGKGLPAGIDDLFEPFVSSKPKGLGLGLSISRSIVEAHGGTLTAWSDTQPSTTFQFTLPVARGGTR
jgi:PAS domain S-box-containing protein